MPETEPTVYYYCDSQEYEEGRASYPIDNCPYPITTTDGKRYRWYMGFYSVRYSCFDHIPESNYLDIDIKNRMKDKA